MAALIDDYDAALFDLDGVLYVGPQAVDGVAAACQELAQRGVKQGFITNNASRSPKEVAAHLTSLGIPAEPVDVVTSAQAIAQVVAQQLSPHTPIFVLGTDALRQELHAVGMRVVDAQSQPQAVVQGYAPTAGVSDIQDACAIIHQGMPWFASNDDTTIPTHRGIMPGMGSYIALIATAVGKQPDVIAGKPHPALFDVTTKRLRMSNPIFVGDRLDTDIAGANATGWDSLFVFSGVHTKFDLALAVPHVRPTYIGMSAAALLEPGHRVGSTVGKVDHTQHRDGAPTAPARTHTEQLEALCALLPQIWAAQDTGVDIQLDVLDQLDLIP